MDITIKVIPNSQHRPPFSGGDWWFDEAGNLEVRVSQMSDWRYEALLGIHEAVEAILCKAHGVPQAAVDAYDTAYQETHSPDLNAGDEPDAPYRHEHCVATAVERTLAADLDVDWLPYDTELGAL